MSVKIALSGPAGSGKSSVIQELCSRYGFITADVGQVFRRRAVDKGMTIAEYDRFLEEHPEEDIEMDKDFLAIVQSASTGVVVSWRVGFHFVPDVISILLTVDPQEAARRVLEADR